MTSLVAPDARSSVSRRPARWAALAFVLPAAAFGLPTPLVLDHLRRTGELPMTPFGFRSHAGPFEAVGPDGFQVLGWALVVVCLLDALAGIWLWQGRRRGARLGVALTPASLALAMGFAFPFLLAAIPIRLLLVAVARRSLR
jgi:hypothetical protein